MRNGCTDVAEIIQNAGEIGYLGGILASFGATITAGYNLVFTGSVTSGVASGAGLGGLGETVMIAAGRNIVIETALGVGAGSLAIAGVSLVVIFGAAYYIHKSSSKEKNINSAYDLIMKDIKTQKCATIKKAMDAWNKAT